MWWVSDRWVLVDGRTRLEAAILARLQFIPCVFRTFDSLNDAKKYIESCQNNRRSTGVAVVLNALIHADLFDQGGQRLAKGTNVPLPRTTLEQIGKSLMVSPRKVKQAKTIFKKLPLETIEDLKSEKQKVYDVVRQYLNSHQAKNKLVNNPISIAQAARRHRLKLVPEELEQLELRLKVEGIALQEHLEQLIRADLQTDKNGAGIPEISSTVSRPSVSFAKKPSARPLKHQCWKDQDLIVVLGCQELSRRVSEKKVSQEAMAAEFAVWLSKVSGHKISPKAVLHQVAAAVAKVNGITDPASRLYVFRQAYIEKIATRSQSSSLENQPQ